jgi:4-hydroxy-tetrahydrodipicolinate synthase
MSDSGVLYFFTSSDRLATQSRQTVAYNIMGGVGCISVTANVAPRLCADFQNA